MKKLISDAGEFGPFQSVETLDDAYLCDGALLPFVVVGGCTIEDCEPPAVPVPIPVSVSPRQIRQALTQFGLRATVETAIAASDQDTKDWYQYATAFERKHPMVLALAQGLNVTETELDQLWTLAGSL